MKRTGMRRAAAVILLAMMLLAFGAFIREKTEYRSDAERFKKEYEVQNGRLDEHFHKMRALKIKQANPIKYMSCEEALKRVDEGGRCYFYFGYAKCPWCRGLVEPMLEAAEECDIQEIVYVDLSKCRDTYAAKNGNAVKLKEGAEGYAELLERFDDVLEEYTVEAKDGEELDTGEKRIYAPTLMEVRNGEAVQVYTGDADFTEPYGEISPELYADMLRELTDFFQVQ